MVVTIIPPLGEVYSSKIRTGKTSPVKNPWLFPNVVSKHEDNTMVFKCWLNVLRCFGSIFLKCTGQKSQTNRHRSQCQHGNLLRCVSICCYVAVSVAKDAPKQCESHRPYHLHGLPSNQPNCGSLVRCRKMRHSFNIHHLFDIQMKS